MSNSISLLTLNVSGLQNRQKRSNMFYWLKKQDVDLMFIQETHCGSDVDKNNWSREWAGESFWTNISTDSVGVAILLSRKLQYETENIKIDPQGRWIKLDICINEHWYCLVNVYAPNKGVARKTFFTRHCKQLIEGEYPKIVGGDFNCTLNKGDRRPMINRTEDGRKELKLLMQDCDLEDVFQRRHPNKKEFTYFKKNAISASRLDMWLLSKELDPFVARINILIAPNTDHRAVTLQLQSEKDNNGPGRWMMNVHVIQSDLFKEVFKTFWNTWKEKQKDFKSIKQWWEETKSRIKDIAIFCGKKIKCKEKHEQNILEKKLKSLQLNEPENHQEINVTQQQLDEINKQKANGSRIRAKVRWSEDGERGTKFFHGLEKSRAANKKWTKIKDKNGNMKYEINDILKRQKEFYEDLYTSEGVNDKAMDELLASLDRMLTEEEKKMCERDVTTNELKTIVMGLKSGSTPGMDGIPYEFYKEFWDEISEQVTQMINEVLTTECTSSQYMGIIILLYKNGTREDVENWRPITLLNCDYKIIEKIFANRLTMILKKLIKEDQKAYIKGRYIGDNARLMEDIIFHCEKNEIDGGIIFIDQSKAYDRVEWKWVKKCLEKFNFGERFIKWIMMLYQSAKSTILTNGHMTEKISLTRGLRQGSPLSALLYILQAEPFAETIRKSNKITGIKIDGEEIRITAYADDTQIYISDKKSKTEMDIILETYSRASGAKINTTKTEGLLIHDMEEIDGIKWSKGPIKALGVPQGQTENLSQFWNKILQKVKKKLDLWKRRDLTLQGRVHIIQTSGISNITYAAGLKTVPDKIVKDINTELWKFLWKDKMEAVKREICMHSIVNGGIGMPDIKKVIKTRQIMMIRRIVSDEDELWKILPRKYLQILDHEYNEEYFLLKGKVSYEKLEQLPIPTFYKECIQAWHELSEKQDDPNTVQEVRKERLWLNPKVKVNGQMLENKVWSKRSIQSIGDLYDIKGKSKVDEITATLDEKDITLYMNKIKAAIPLEWKDSLKVEHSDIEYNNDMTMKYKGQEIILTKVSSKLVYSILQGKNRKNRWEIEWEEKVGEIQWDNIYMAMKNKLVDRRSKDVHWKSIVYGLTTDTKLSKMKRSNGLCIFCDIEMETVEHLFCDCELIEMTWATISKLCKELWNISCDSVKRICLIDLDEIVNNDNNAKNVVEYIIMSTKWIVWKRRNLLKYEDIWINDSDTKDWVINYLKQRTKTILKMKVDQKIKKELVKLLAKLNV